MPLINIFQYNHEFWGPVSDWAMVVVTITTAYFIWRTLRSQTKVQMLQQQTTQIENEKFRLQVLPEIKLYLSDENKNIKEQVGDNTISDLKFTLVLEKNDCKDLKLNFSLDKHCSLSLTKYDADGSTDLSYLQHGTVMQINICFSTRTYEFSNKGASVKIIMSFADVVSNKYLQIFEYSFDYATHNIKQNPPKRNFKNK